MISERYVNELAPHAVKFTKITVPASKTVKVNNFVSKIIRRKILEEGYAIDNGQMETRYRTGFTGEAALEEMLGVELIDWSVGDSQYYDVPDLKNIGLDVGIKTVEYGKFPVIHRRFLRPEIINIKMTDNTVYVCGLASVEVLQEYQDDELILSPKLREKGTKTGFFGFHALKQFCDTNDLQKILQPVK